METVSGRGRMAGFDRWHICQDSFQGVRFVGIPYIHWEFVQFWTHVFLTPKTDFSIRHDRMTVGKQGMPKIGHIPFSRAFITNPPKRGRDSFSSFPLASYFPHPDRTPFNQFYYHSRFFGRDIHAMSICKQSLFSSISRFIISPCGFYCWQGATGLKSPYIKYLFLYR